MPTADLPKWHRSASWAGKHGDRQATHTVYRKSPLENFSEIAGWKR